MHAIIKHLPLQKITDWAALSQIVDAFEAMLRTQYPTFRGCTLIRAGKMPASWLSHSTPVRCSTTSLGM